ncbi:hypothetical protein SUGI_0980100 [Cryptomeria japonica]|nr:hypothetical protein SUGI_0980070 [Cryptomeria japonica]GLJ46506.1 hypothetical protein SUGI_0980100 [Cryptomeria japonica]
MAKKYVYVYVLLLLLMASSAFASEPMVYDYNGLCGFWSGYYKGVCDAFTSGCHDTCQNYDHALVGGCVATATEIACICYNPC